MTDHNVESAQSRLAAAEQAIAAREALSAPNPLVDAHRAAQKELDKAKLLCSDECGVADQPTDLLELEVASARAEAHHAPHRAALEAAYAKFSLTGHAIGGTLPAPSNPASGKTPISADVVVTSASQVDS
jgi:hypothetical protein